MINISLITNLQSHIAKLMNSEKILYKFLLVNFLIVCFDIIGGWLLYKISQGSLNLVIYYVGCDIISNIYDKYFCDLFNNKVGMRIKLAFKKEAIEKYDTLSWDSKNKSTADNFNTKMSQASGAINALIVWGIPNIMAMISSFVQCLVVFCFSGLYLPLFLICATNIAAYIFYTKNKQIKFTKSVKSARESSDKIKSLINLFLPMFQQREKSSSDIYKMSAETDIVWHNVDKQWINIMAFTQILNKLCVIFISFGMIDSVAGFILLIKTIGSFNGSISNLTSFLNQNNRFETDYESYIKFFDGLSYKSHPIKKELPSELNIIGLNIAQGGFNLKFDHNIKKLDLRSDSKILIQGRTGHGKSTFVNALMGKISGLQFNLNKPENYFHSFVDMYQNIREKMPTSTISIRQLFNAELNDNIIMQCLKPCFPDNDLERIMNNLKNSSNTNDLKTNDIDFADSDTDDFNEHSQMMNKADIENQLDIVQAKQPTNPLDVEILERLSGGEKTRLALATRIYQMITNPDKKIIILDEPEQGSDPEIAIKVIRNIFELFPDKMIIMVSHICECSLYKLNIKWHHRLNINQGIVYKV